MSSNNLHSLDSRLEQAEATITNLRKENERLRSLGITLVCELADRCYVCAREFVNETAIGKKAKRVLKIKADEI